MISFRKLAAALMSGFLLLFGGSQAVHGFDGRGSPISSWIPSELIGGEKRVGQIGEDRDGSIYLVAGSSLMKGDGEGWKRLTPPNVSPVERVLFADDGTIYVGTREGLGVLDSSGAFVSIADRFPVELRENRGWRPVLFDEAGTLFVVTGENVLSLSKDGEVEAWSLGGQVVQHFFELNGEKFLTFVAGGLLRLEPDGKIDRLKSIKWKRVSAACVLGDGEAMLSVRGVGIARFDGENLEAIGHPDHRRSYTFLEPLDDGRVIAFTADSGVWVLDRRGFGRFRIMELQGVGTRRFQTAHVASDGSLWLGHGSGIFRVDLKAPLSLFNHRHGLSDPVSQVMELGGVMYFVTDGGVYRFLNKQMKRMVPVGEIADEPTLAYVAGGMLVASRERLDLVSELGKTRVLGFGNYRCIEPSILDPMKAIAGLRDGIQIWVRSEDEWNVSSTCKELEGEGVLTIAQNSKGEFWLELERGRLARVSNLGDVPPKAEVFAAGELGLPPTGARPFAVGEGFVFKTKGERLLQWNETTRRFAVSEDHELLTDDLFLASFKVMISDEEGNFWVNKSAKSGTLALLPAGPYFKGLRSLAQGTSHRANTFHVSGDGVLWVGSDAGVVRSVVSMDPPGIRTFDTRIRDVFDLETGKSVFSGAEMGRDGEYVLPYSKRSLRFMYSLDDYETPGMNQYQVFLEGYQSDWSEPSREAYKDFTNLPFGDYEFQVMGTNDYGDAGEIARVAFRIQRPWHMRIEAYVFYVLSLMGAIWAWYLLRSRNLRLSNLALTKNVEEKTKDLALKNSELEVALEQAHEMKVKAEHADRAKSEFLANMSHEIRTPMNGILGMCTILSDTKLSDEQEGYLSTVRNSGESLLTIINDILDYSKIEAGKLEIEQVEFDVGECVEEVLELLAHAADCKGINMYCDLEPGLPLERIGDSTRIRQVIVNLVGNALKFTEEGEISVSVRSESSERGDLVRFDVVDTGIGIPEEKVDGLFKAFSQVDASINRRFGGTGLGLSICRSLVEMMGGEISVTSELGKGSCFSFTIGAPAKGSQREEFVPEHAFLKGKRLLIVEDYETPLRIYEHLAAQCEAFAQVVREGETALELLAKKADGYDLVWLGAHLKDVDTEGFVKRLRATPGLERLPVVAMTNAGQSALTAKLKKLPACACLVNPVRRSLLLRVSATALGFSESRVAREEVLEEALPDGGEESRERRILLVDDNNVNLKVARHMLKKIGLKADTASDGLQALDAYSRVKYDVILMDAQMPEMDGLEATRRIRSDYPKEEQPYIIAMTAGATEIDRERCADAGMDGFVAKPIKVDKLKAALEDGFAARSDRS
ncbi:response regulator [Pelagicoccus mobilis]|uniref:Sensory/regulatory protein RpfC n=1 Tax=Pelagicoccus mobilis TaxID=415221 RepID=A0A934RSL8_9BACT|nr:response regulator [Pelagicoccus mobilis]MBK1875621.1 response regulator [Pelagicoccus mobilis]